jgi:putative transposase
MYRSSCRYEFRPDPDSLWREVRIPLTRQKPRFGYRRLWALLVKRGHQVNVKRVYRLYRLERAAVCRSKRKRLERAAPVNVLLTALNQEWGLEFVIDAVASGCGFRILTVVDGFTRECPALEVGIRLGSPRVTGVLVRVIAERCAPQTLRCDNGPEFTSRHIYGSSEQRGIRLVHMEPGSSVQNGYVESFNGRFRDECLNANWFLHIGDATQKIGQWRMEYNEERPHSSLAYSTPKEYAGACSDSGSRMDAIPPSRPPVVASRTAVLAGTGSPVAASWWARPCLLRTAVHEAEGATGGSGGMAGGVSMKAVFQIKTGREKRE